MTTIHLSCLASIVVGLGGCFSPNQPVGGDGSADEDSTGATDGSADSNTVGPTTTLTTGPTNTTDGTQGDATQGTDPTSGTDPTTETDPTSETLDTSAGSTDDGGPLCGNGMMDGAEACDDGDRVNGNGCNNDCVESGSVLWEVDVSQGYDVVQNTGLPFNESIAAAAVGGVAVTVAIELVDRAALTRWIDEDGEIVWGETWSAFNGEVLAADVAIGANGDVIVVGGQDTGTLFFSPFPVIRAYDENGVELWSDAPDYGTPEDRALFTTVAVDPRGRILVRGGTTLNAGQLLNLLYVYDLDGDVILVESLPDEGGETLIVESALGGDDSIYAVHFGNDGGDSSLTRQTSGAVDVWSVELPGVAASGVAFGGEQIAVAGISGLNAAWVGVFDEDRGGRWSDTFEGVAGAVFNAVAVDGDGSVIAVGRLSDLGDRHAWVRKFASDGAVLWDREFDGDVGLDGDAAQDVSLDAAGNVYVVTRREAGAADATWVVKLTP